MGNNRRYALISVSNKERIVEFAKELLKHGFEMLASGGTHEFLKKAKVKSNLIQDITQFPEILGGRVKTLHPKIFAGILANKDDASHLKELKELDIPSIDLVICNLYPFKEKPSIENIDIGGVSLIRAAAKNHKHVACVTRPDQYKTVIDELNNYGEIKHETKLGFAKEAFLYTAQFDSLIAEFLGAGKLNLIYEKTMDLRYGENAHQTSSLYREVGYKGTTILNAKKLQGKELSFNNIFDLDTAIAVVKSFDEPCVCILKHANPCGVAIGKDLLDAYVDAHKADPISSFGGIVGLNREVNEAVATEITKTFIEAVVAPSFTKEAIAVLSQKKNMRVLECPISGLLSTKALRWINGGILIQDNDILPDEFSEWKVVTKRKPTQDEFEACKFGFTVVRFVKSNAVLISTGRMTVGIGAGQPNRVGALEIALKNKDNFGFKEGLFAIASDGFFPFRDSIDLAHKAGIKVVIQPGGSRRDQEVIDACDELNMSMIFTGRRHFRH
jgi:phosphoribosylaminoimidazolecarboxamide formyltransferase/IMP cyclohydrolase